MASPDERKKPAMNVRTDPRSSFETALHSVAGQLVERVATLPEKAARPQLLRWLLAIGAIFIAWRMWRGLKGLFWIAFGLGMALFWTGMWRVIF
jgi:hypothetical protein